jgi:putative ABC transport system substrate-binding protein
MRSLVNRLSRRSFVRAIAGVSSVMSITACTLRRQERIARIGFMSGDEPALVAAFETELANLGYVQGENIHLVSRLARPRSDDNATHAELPPGVTARRLRLLKEAAPRVARIALLSTTPGTGGHETQLVDAQTGAAGLGITVFPYRASSSSELDAALRAIERDEMDGLLNFQGGLGLVNRGLIVRFANERRMPAVYQSELFVESGGLMAWAPDQREQYRNGARYADRIIRGARPGDLPVQYPQQYYLTLNLSSADRIGLQLPAGLVSRADRRIS